MKGVTQQHHQHLEVLTEGLSSEEIQRIFSAGKRVDGRAGQTIYRAGDPAVNMFVVVHGLLLARYEEDEHGQPNRYLRPGDHFGEISLLVASRRPLTVQAITNVVLLAIAKADFDRLVHTIPRFAANLCRSLAEWLIRQIDGQHVQVFPRAVALLRTTPLTDGLATQIVAALGDEHRLPLVLTDRPAAWSGVMCDCHPFALREEGDGQRESFLAPIITALEEDFRVFIDLPADRIPPAWLLHCQEVWLLQECGTDATIVDQLLRPVPELADRLRVIWLFPDGDRLPPVTAHGLNRANRQIRARVTGSPARVHARCLARLTHRLQGIQLGLALGGGGALGAAHIGVIRALDRAGIYFDRLAGTSIGSVVAAGYAAGFSADEIGRFFLEDLNPPRFLRFLPKGNLWYMLAHYRLGWFESKLRRRLYEYTFDQLLLPMHTVTADLQSGAEVVREEGDVTRAILESINLPGISRPIRRDGHVLVDGGVLNNVPADVLRARHANFVVASHLLTELHPEVGSQLWQLMLRIMEVQMRRLVTARNPAIDVTVTPLLAAFRFEDFSQSAGLIEAGEEAGEKMVPEIRRKLAERMTPHS
jgi:predicted acylesterase/phospholipase RssA/CRP-like cAMP-binding protein